MSPPEDGFATLTHARLRAAQGDVRGAREILRTLLARDPSDTRARALLRSLETGGAEHAHAEPDLEPELPREAADAAVLRAAFRNALDANARRSPAARRLRAFASAIAVNRGERRGAR